MFNIKLCLIACLILCAFGNVFGADVILSEYNAVDESLFLNGGTAMTDLEGSRASDSYFGRIMGNGGDWFELVVITDHLDMRGWKLDIYNGGLFDETLNLTDHDIWADLRSGTIITVSENIPSDISYDPAGGDWWVNVQAANVGSGLYIENSNFAVTSDLWQLGIRNSSGIIIYGPAGEGISPASGVSDIEIFRLEKNPSVSIVPASVDYDDGDSLSTFGSANQWGVQDYFLLRSVAAEASTLSLLTPSDAEIIMGGTSYDITWSNTGIVSSVDIDFSTDNGNTWAAVYPRNVGNSGSYKWLVPIVDSEDCIVRVRNAGNLAVGDTNQGKFTIYECLLDGELTGDCIVDLNDLAVMAASWLDCGNPFDVACSE